MTWHFPLTPVFFFSLSAPRGNPPHRRLRRDEGFKGVIALRSVSVRPEDSACDLSRLRIRSPRRRRPSPGSFSVECSTASLLCLSATPGASNPVKASRWNNSVSSTTRNSTTPYLQPRIGQRLRAGVPIRARTVGEAMEPTAGIRHFPGRDRPFDQSGASGNDI